MKYLFLSLLLFLGSCGEEVGLDLSCPSSFSHFGNAQTITQGATEKISQQIVMNGFTSYKVHIDTVTIQMESSNLTDVTMQVYKDQTGGHVHTPDDGTLLGTSVVTSGLGSSDTTDQIQFSFSPTIELEVSQDYYFIISANGGSYTVSIASPTSLANTQVNKYNGSWSTPYSSGANISFNMNVSHCERI